MFRVFVAGRDKSNRSSIGFVDIELRPDSARVIGCCSTPILRPGPLGAFDDSGVLPSCLTTVTTGTGNELLLYYTGVALGVTVPFYYLVGLARSRDGISWERWSNAPFLERTPVDPLLVASPWIVLDAQTFHMWYVSGVRWSIEPDGPRHYYHIRHATSVDGIQWQRTGAVAIDFSAGEYALSRPTICRASGGFRMWFAARGRYYQIYEASSLDGTTWRRKQDPVLTPSPSGWDSEMTCYPAVFEHQGQLYMLYNGNGYGRSGFGLAIWEDDSC